MVQVTPELKAGRYAIWFASKMFNYTKARRWNRGFLMSAMLYNKKSDCALLANRKWPCAQGRLCLI